MRTIRCATWRGGQCLEVVDNLPVVPVRDSRNPHGPALVFPLTAWASFTIALRK
ncbi:DUF397 domain-containing protein [Streptomyces sp. SID12501]|uniref:DUF397 domain-containing protein n=1 Tax=Streptomyces sp. SID12501 TaxID=2706042 RepID=A0A6B3BR07_9ACTN|nr:DUF397 domain-containing protein [Streptomyces sp. SID12501]